MPIRIKPTHDLGPCILSLDSIRQIVERIERDFPVAIYFANDGVWEIFGEPHHSFLNAISQRDSLDSFIVHAETDVANEAREIKLIFNEDEATAICTAPPEAENWFKHFLMDIKEYILTPSFAQLVAHRFGQHSFYLNLPLILVPFNASVASSTPYCKIVIQEKPPDPFVENIKANLISNIIWALIVFVLGVATTLITQGILAN